MAKRTSELTSITSAHTTLPDQRPNQALRLRKARGRGHERYDEILNAAEAMFAQEGLTQVSTRALAQAVGLSHAALFQHFPTREALLAALCHRAIARFDMFLETQGPDILAGEGSVPAKLAAVLKLPILFALADANAYRLIFLIERHGDGGFLERAAATPAGSPMPAAIALFQRFAGMLANLGVTGGATLLSAFAAAHGLAALLVTRPEFPWGPHEILIERHVALLAAALETTR